MQEQFKSHKSVNQISKKHRIDVSFVMNQLKMGEKIEHEHTKNHVLAREIALQHLDEIPDYYTRLKKMESDAKKNVKEETKSGDGGLHDWFNKSKSSDGKKGWVQLGGKFAGKPCARQSGQTSTPKCGSSKMAANLSAEEEERSQVRKNRLDPNQPQKTGAAKPTNVKTESLLNKYNRLVKEKMNEQSFSIDSTAHRTAQRQQKIRNLSTGNTNPNEKSSALKKLPGPSLPLADEFINEVKDKPTKGSGKKDACYSKVKSRYDVWPSAYASGALVKCRKVGADNWGTKSEETVVDEAQKCWPGYKKKGTKKMFGKTYNNCVKESKEIKYCPLCKKNETKSECSFGPSLWEKYSIAKVHPANEEKDYEFQMARNELQTAKRSIDKLMKKLKGEGNMEAWVQSKITKASDYLDSVSDYMEGDRDEIDEGMSMKDFKANRKKNERRAASADAEKRGHVERTWGTGRKYTPDEAKSGREKMSNLDRSQRYRVANDPDSEHDDYPSQKTKNPKKLRKQKAMGELGESNLMKYNEYGQTYVIRFTWRGLMYKVQIFIPSLKRPSAEEIKSQLNKIYPGAMLLQFEPRENDPVDPTIVFAKEEKELDEGKSDKKLPDYKRSSARLARYDNPSGALALGGGQQRSRRAEHQERRGKPKRWWDDDGDGKGYEKGEVSGKFKEDLDINEVAAWQRKEGKNPSGGLNKKGIESYRRENPGSKLSMAVTTPPSKLKPGSKSANRRKSFCARMGGVEGPMKDEKGRPTRKALALKKWNC